MSIPISKATLKTINRFPELYRRQSLQVINAEAADAIRTTADSFVMASMLALIEEFHFGTTKNSTKLTRFIARLQSIIDTNAEFYDDAIAIGLKNQLSDLGVEYKF